MTEQSDNNGTPALPLASGALTGHALRLRPGNDLVSCLQRAAEQAMDASNDAPSACVLTAVGSVSHLQLRMANASAANIPNNPFRTWDEPLEIVSLVGTFGRGGGKHLHMCVSDKNGVVYGGHVVSGTVHTTCEVVFGTMQNVSFTREHDDATGYSELVVRQVE